MKDALQLLMQAGRTTSKRPQQYVQPQSINPNINSPQPPSGSGTQPTDTTPSQPSIKKQKRPSQPTPTTTPRTTLGFLTCPVCNKSIPAAIMDLHLQSCLDAPQTTAKKPNPTTTRTSTVAASNSNHPSGGSSQQQGQVASLLAGQAASTQVPASVAAMQALTPSPITLPLTSPDTQYHHTVTLGQRTQAHQPQKLPPTPAAQTQQTATLPAQPSVPVHTTPTAAPTPAGPKQPSVHHHHHQQLQVGQGNQPTKRKADAFAALMKGAATQHQHHVFYLELRGQEWRWHWWHKGVSRTPPGLPPPTWSGTMQHKETVHWKGSSSNASAVDPGSPDDESPPATTTSAFCSQDPIATLDNPLSTLDNPLDAHSAPPLASQQDHTPSATQLDGRVSSVGGADGRVSSVGGAEGRVSSGGGADGRVSSGGGANGRVSSGGGANGRVSSGGGADGQGPEGGRVAVAAHVVGTENNVAGGTASSGGGASPGSSGAGKVSGTVQVTLHLLTNVPQMEGGIVDWTADLVSNHTIPPEGRWQGLPSGLKSALQKCVRLGRASPAVRIALQMLKSDPGELLRRLPVICVEDSLLHPHLPLVVWLMAAHSKGYQLGQLHVAALLQITYQMASAKVRDNLPPPNMCPGQPMRSMQGIDMALGNQPQEAVLIKCLLLRAHFGGMQGDVTMLKGYATYWGARLQGVAAKPPPLPHDINPSISQPSTSTSQTSQSSTSHPEPQLTPQVSQTHTAQPSPLYFPQSSHPSYPLPGYQQQPLEHAPGPPPVPHAPVMTSGPHVSALTYASVGQVQHPTATPPYPSHASVGPAQHPTATPPYPSHAYVHQVSHELPTLTLPAVMPIPEQQPSTATGAVAPQVPTVPASAKPSSCSPWMHLIIAVHDMAVPPTLALPSRVGPLRKGDIPLSSIDHHVSDVINHLLSQEPVHQAALEITRNSWGNEGDPMECLRSAMWMFRSSTNARVWLPHLYNDGGPDASKVCSEHYTLEGDIERENAHKSRLQPLWDVAGPAANAYSSSLISNRFRPVRHV